MEMSEYKKKFPDFEKALKNRSMLLSAEPDSTYPEEVKQDACNRQVKSCGDQCGCKDKDTCKDK